MHDVRLSRRLVCQPLFQRTLLRTLYCDWLFYSVALIGLRFLCWAHYYRFLQNFSVRRWVGIEVISWLCDRLETSFGILVLFLAFDLIDQFQLRQLHCIDVWARPHLVEQPILLLRQCSSIGIARTTRSSVACKRLLAIEGSVCILFEHILVTHI